MQNQPAHRAKTAAAMQPSVHLPGFHPVLRRTADEGHTAARSIVLAADTRKPAQPGKAPKRPASRKKTSGAPAHRVDAPHTPNAKTGSDGAGGLNLNRLLSPGNLEESLGTIVTLRGFCKKCLKYVNQADNLLDTLFVTTNSLKETGVLKKLAESKGKNLNSGDLTNILMALMNSPLGNNVFQRLGGSEKKESPPPAQAAVPAAPQNGAAPPNPERPPQGGMYLG